MQVALEFDSISKTYRDFLGRKPFIALNDFSLTVNRGEIFGFLGPNGAGKTTAIHLALGLMFVTRGKGTMLGKSFGDARTRRKVGFLAESTSYYNRTAEGALRFYGELDGVNDAKLKNKIKELLEVVDLKNVTYKSIGKFSRGMLQRIGVAQALLNDPELLILDEPTSALDPASRVMVRELLLRARDQGKTVFLSSHLLSEIEMICDRVGIISHGRLVRLGPVTELIESKDECEIVARVAQSTFDGMQVGADGLTRLVVSVAEQRLLIEKIWGNGGEIVSVTHVKKSLEDIFLSLTDDGGQE